MTRRTTPRFSFLKALKTALPGWDVSLVFVGETRAQALNKQLRNKDYVPNVLSYETGTKSGEVIICLSVAKKQAPSYDLSYEHFVGYLFIHALMHLKGYPHGHTMDTKERALLARFITSTTDTLIHGSTHRDRHRHRNTPDKSRGR